MDEKLLEFNRKIKEKLLAEIDEYIERSPGEEGPLRLREFIHSTDHLFSRDAKGGHITCSAWILDDSRTQAVLVRHRRLNLWIQPGGHIEPFETPQQGALRESSEETNITDLKLLDPKIFHISIMDFPEGKDGPAHLHYDLRYLIQAPPGAQLSAADEIDGAQWVPMDALADHSDENTILVMAQKTARWIRRSEG